MSVGSQGLDYELKVYKAMQDAGIPGLELGDKPTAGFSNVGAGDIQATYNGKPFNIEIKMSRKDQMGAGQLIYDRSSGRIIPHENLRDKTEPQDLEQIIKAAEETKSAVDKYLDRLNVLGIEATGLPVRIPKQIRDQMTKDGFAKPINATVETDAKHIIAHYNKKGVFYIQVGGAGLFYLGQNPFNLNIPAFAGTARIEMRLKFGGGKGDGLRRGEWVAIGRMMTDIKSPYSLDNVQSIKSLFGGKQPIEFDGPKGADRSFRDHLERGE